MRAEPRLGLIIPSGNTLTERQFNRYLPPELGVHVTRLRMTGRWRKPWVELRTALVEAAEALSDVDPGLIVFHCTANSMENGLAHEAAIIETIEQAAGRPAITTAQAVTEAFRHLGIKKVVLISPYVKETNAHEVAYLTEAGFTVVHELGLGLESHAYSRVTPAEWRRVGNENSRAEAEGYFLSCTNTRMIETIADLESDLGKPVVNSNQATMWSCLRRLGVGYVEPTLGRLFRASDARREDS